MFSVGFLGEHLGGRSCLGFFITMVGVALYKLVPKRSPEGDVDFLQSCARLHGVGVHVLMFLSPIPFILFALRTCSSSLAFVGQINCRTTYIAGTPSPALLRTYGVRGVDVPDRGASGADAPDVSACC